MPGHAPSWEALLSVDFAKHNIDAADDRDNVGDQAAFGHLRERLQFHEAGGPQFSRRFQALLASLQITPDCRSIAEVSDRTQAVTLALKRGLVQLS